ncbi:hypothetical protein AMTRI_Chr10g227290 [Amborella trichopoda]
MAQRHQSKEIPPKISGIPVVERGPCYNCDEKYSPQHRWKDQKLYLLDGNTIDENKHEEDNPEISMHSLAGINSPQTIRVQGYIKKQSVTILIYSGSIDNFIDHNITKQVELHIYPCENFEIMIVNGGKLA